MSSEVAFLVTHTHASKTALNLTVYITIYMHVAELDILLRLVNRMMMVVGQHQ